MRKDKFINRLNTWISKKSQERGSFPWAISRLIFAIIHLRIPRHWGMAGLWRFISQIFHRRIVSTIAKEALQENKKNFYVKIENAKILYASPVGVCGKPYLEKIINRFKDMNVDFLIFSYDEATFDESIFGNCKIIRDKGFKWYFMKKYLTPEVCKDYDYVMTWDDDLDILNFNLREFLNTMVRNGLEVAQPALSDNSYRTHWMTIQRKGTAVGRLTDAVEIMAQVFHKDAWNRFWNIMEPDWNYWGWGYDLLGNDLCGFKRTAVLDSQVVYHTKKLANNSTARKELSEFCSKHPNARQARYISFGNLI